MYSIRTLGLLLNTKLDALPCLDLCKIRPSYLSSSVGRALGLESGVSWVRVPPEAADFSLKKIPPQVSLNRVVSLCLLVWKVSLSLVIMYVYTMYMTIYCIVVCTWEYCDGTQNEYMYMYMSASIERV